MGTHHRPRLGFIDALRGLAFVFMALNHTASSLLSTAVGTHRETAIYLTVTLAAPLFLFLVGFSMALSHDDRSSTAKRYVDHLKKSLLLIVLGFGLTAVTEPGQPIFTGGILQTIGLGMILLAPFMRYMPGRVFRYALLTVAVGLYVVFVLTYPALMTWLGAAPLALQLFFDGYPPWPWISVIMLGLVLGSQWGGEPQQQNNLARMLGSIAGLCVAWYFLAGYLTGNPTDIGFGRDFVIDRHWLPSPITIFWILGALFANFAILYYLVEISGWRMAWLRSIGRHALLLYVAHLLVIRVLGKRVLDLDLKSWWLYVALNLALLASMLVLAQAATRWQQRRMVAA